MIISKLGEIYNFKNNNIIYNRTTLSGVRFQLIADDDIFTGYGDLVYHKGDLIKDFIINNNNYEIKDLYLGKYKLVELKTLEGYILNNKPYYFDIEFDLCSYIIGR